MTDFRRPFGPDELPDDATPSDDLARSLGMGRELEAGIGPAIPPTSGFSDRVMAAVAAEPVPQPTVAAGRALRSGRLVAVVASVRDAWRVAFGRGRPGLVRAQAFALVLVSAVALAAVGGVAAVGALNAFGPERSLPVVPAPSPSPSPSVSTVSPAPFPSPPPSPSPSPSASATDLATPSPDRTRTPEPTRTSEPRGTDDHHETDEPHETEKPNRTETPKPTESDDHGGSSETDEPSDDHSTDDHSGPG